MYNVIFNKYVMLVVSILVMYYFLFKFKSMNEKYIKVLGITSAVTGFLVVLSQILELENLLVIPVSGGLFIMFALFTVNALKMRKVPEKRVYCNIFLGIMIFLVISFICIFILIKTGFYG